MSNGTMELPEDLAFEQLVKRTFESRPGNLKLHKLPQFTAADFLVEKQGKVVGLVEVRRRDVRREQYKELFFGVAKHAALHRIADGFGDHLAVNLVVLFRDGAFWTPLPKLPEWEQTNGSRGESMEHTRSTDNERVWLIPVAGMQPFSLVTEDVAKIGETL